MVTPPEPHLHRSPSFRAGRRDVVRLGFIPLVHAAPLLVARQYGMFRRHGLEVRLSREVGWATIREKIVGGELDAAQALAPLPLAITLGLGSTRVDCLTALVMTVHGDTLVLSRRIWNATQGDPAEFRKCRNFDGDLLTFGIVYPHSAQAFLLRRWLSQASLVPDVDYRLVVVPPQQMAAHLKAGHIDGACVGEPWGSLAVQGGFGVIAALSADLAPGHPEKVLLVRRSYAEQRHHEHLALVAALLEACAWCADPAHHEELITLLSSRDGLAIPPAGVRPGITGEIDLGCQRQLVRRDALCFHGPGINEPSLRHAEWLSAHLGPELPRDFLQSIYRSDLFHAARPVNTPVAAVQPTEPNLSASPHETHHCIQD